MCTVLLPPDVNTVAVSKYMKYIISFEPQVLRLQGSPHLSEYLMVTLINEPTEQLAAECKGAFISHICKNRLIYIYIYIYIYIGVSFFI